LDIDDAVESAWDLAALATGGVRLLIAAPIGDPAALKRRIRRVTRLLTHGWLQAGRTA